MLFRFATPEWLLLLLLLPLLAWLLGRRGPSAAIAFSSARLLRGIQGIRRRRPGFWLAVARLLTLALLIAALARPQLGEGTVTEEASGVDILLAIDISGSMWAHDFEIDGDPVDRLTAVKSVVAEFIQQRPSDRIGLIAFAGAPYLISPLTLNHDWLQENLERLRIGMVEDGTAIGSAIAMGTNRLRNLEADSRILILLTDGANNAGELEPVQAAEAASAYEIRIYAIGAGREGIVPVPRTDPGGNIYRDSRGRPILRQGRSEIDLETLDRVATITEGEAFHAENTEALKRIYDAIDQLEKTEVEQTFRANYRDAFAWPLATGLLLFALEQGFRRGRYRHIP